MDANSRRKRDPSNKSPVPPLSDSPFLSTASARNPYLSTCSSPCPTLRIPLAARNRTESLPSVLDELHRWFTVYGGKFNDALVDLSQSLPSRLTPLPVPPISRPAARFRSREKERNASDTRALSKKNRRKRLSPFRQFSFLCSRFEKRGEKEAFYVRTPFPEMRFGVGL